MGAAQLRVTKECAARIGCQCSAADHVLSTGEAEQRFVIAPVVDEWCVKERARRVLGHSDQASMNTGDTAVNTGEVSISD
jgi:hypothetical protein